MSFAPWLFFRGPRRFRPRIETAPVPSLLNLMRADRHAGYSS